MGLYQLPILGVQDAGVALIFIVAGGAADEHGAHEVVVGGVGVAVLGVLHEAGDAPSEAGAGVLGDDVLDGLAELEGPVLGGCLLGEVVAEADHGGPAVAVEVVDGAAGADEQVVVVAQGPQRRAHLHVEVRVEACVHRHDRRRRTTPREHPDQHEVRVVDPVEGRVAFGLEAFGFEHLDAPVRRLDVRVELVVGVLGRVHVRDGRLVRRRIRGDLDFVVQCVPMRPWITQLSISPSRYNKRNKDVVPRKGRCWGWNRIPIITTPLMPFASASSPHFFQ